VVSSKWLVFKRPSLAGFERPLTLTGVRLIAGLSPQDVKDLAIREGLRWSFFLIDGDHDGEAPLRDAQVCARYAADDAMAVFHDLAAPDVARGLAWFRSQGWRVMVYRTMQVIGIAWRGAARPIEHYPDPVVSWRLPEHLRAVPVDEPRLCGSCAGKRTDYFEV
jgi:hypothetical protein